jgi:hypothetical protein
MHVLDLNEIQKTYDLATADPNPNDRVEIHGNKGTAYIQRLETKAGPNWHCALGNGDEIITQFVLTERAEFMEFITSFFQDGLAR